MASSPVILEYEPPPLPLTARVGRLVAKGAQAVWRRRPWAAELLVFAWLTLCVANIVQAVKCWSSPYAYFTPPIYVWHWLAYSIAVVLAAFWGLARQRRWRAMVICGGVMLFTGVASGTLQLSSCPHATYLQVAGLYVPVFGDPCNNPQGYYLRPWWMV